MCSSQLAACPERHTHVPPSPIRSCSDHLAWEELSFLEDHEFAEHGSLLTRLLPLQSLA